MFVSDLEMTLTSLLYQIRTNSNLPRKYYPVNYPLMGRYFKKILKHKENETSIYPQCKKMFFLIAVFCLNATTMFAGNTANTTPTVPASKIEVSMSEKWVNFKWMTSIQANFNYYEVERSIDNKNFKTVGMVMDGFEAAQSPKILSIQGIKNQLSRVTKRFTTG